MTSFTSDAAGRRTTTSYPNGVTTTRTYDAGRPATIVHAKGTTTLRSYTYSRNAVGRVTSKTVRGTDGVDRLTSYTRDDLNRVTGVT